MNVARAKASRLLRDCCITACMLFTLFSCTKETYRGGDILDYGGEPVEVELSLRVSSVQVVGARLNENGTLASPMTRTAEEPDKLEKQVNDIWVFQFTADGARQVGAPRYYTVQTADDGLEPVAMMLHACENSQIFVVANTHKPAWGSGKEGFSLTQLRNQTLIFTSEQNVYGDGKGVPMAALVKQTITAGQPGSLSVTLKSLVAKIQFTYELGTVVAGKMHVVSVNLVNVPDRVRLGNAVEANTSVYPGDAAFKALEYAALEGDVKEGTTYTWYIPQNRQGVVENPDKDQTLKNRLAPQHALNIRLTMSSDMDGGNYEYTVYPGGDVYGDFNVQNGHCYKVNMKINTDKTDDRVLAAPSNCYVMKSGASLVFDPYDRREKSRGYDYLDYKTYVNKAVPAKTIKRVDVLWQTKYNGKLAIGDNTSSKLVYLDENDLVHVTAGGEGNAVIAGYNASGTIVWSWHIWVNDDTPAQLSKAVTYTTYPWDASHIYGEGSGKPRVAGFPFMSCNLGAMNNISGIDAGADACGLFYQWGRKDPFPQKREFTNINFEQYTYANGIVQVYDATGTLIALGNPTTGVSASGILGAVITDAQVGTIEYTIQHPTTFIAGTKQLGWWYGGAEPTQGGAAATNNPDNYVQSDGNWYWTPNDGGSYDKNDRFWGGEPFGAPGQTVLTIDGEQIVANNGATAETKSIFDPCPAGWILPAADAWMGFTIDGLGHGPSISGESGTPATSKLNATWKLYMIGSFTETAFSFYMQDWRSGETLHFPANGMRIPDGGFARVGQCGAYFTSAASPGGAAFIFHFHNGEVIPYDNLPVFFRFNRRSTGCSIRCVRTSK